MARISIGVTVGPTVNPKNPNEHKTMPVAAADTGDVYLSYDSTKITGFSQLTSAISAAIFAISNGNFKVNS